MLEQKLTFNRSLVAAKDNVYQIIHKKLPNIFKSIPPLTFDTVINKTKNGQNYKYKRRWLIDVTKTLPWYIGQTLPFKAVTVYEKSSWKLNKSQVNFTLTVPNYPELVKKCSGAVFVKDDVNNTSTITITVKYKLDIGSLGVPAFVTSWLENQAEALIEKILNNKIDQARQQLVAMLNKSD